MNSVELPDADRVTLADDLAGALPEVKPYRFGQASAQPTMRLAGIDRLGERIARHLRAAIEPIARAKTQVAAEPIRALSFEAWRAELPDVTSISQLRLLPLKGGALVATDPAFVTRLVDAFYGGVGRPAKDRPREFTPIEDRLRGRLTAAVSDALAAAWADVAELQPTLLGHETNPGFVSFVRGGEQVVVQSFMVTPGPSQTAAISIVYTAAGLRPFEPQLAAKVPGEVGEADPEWSARLAKALEQVRLPVRSVLARPEMTMSQLLDLKPGDVIPVTLPPRAPLIVADCRLALGTLGDRDGKAALMVEQVFGSAA